MRCLGIAIALSLVSCTSGPVSDLPAIRDIRSATAEWALINREAGGGKLTKAYVRGMRAAARKEIEDAAAALHPSTSPAARHAAALLALPDDAPVAVLRRHAAALKHIEIALELS